MAAPGQAGCRPAPGYPDSGGIGRGGASKLSGDPVWLIRRLTHSDLSALQPVRLKALRDHPEAFGSSFEEEQADLPGMARLIVAPPGLTLGGFVAGRLVGTTCLSISERIKQQHKGHLTAVYVTPESRGIGLAAALLRDIIEYARKGGLITLTLSVTIGNEYARRLYLRAGFRSYGIEPRSLLVNGDLWDEELMVLSLDGET